MNPTVVATTATICSAVTAVIIAIIAAVMVPMSLARRRAESTGERVAFAKDSQESVTQRLALEHPAPQQT
jgi:hypothetical protein